MSQIASEDEKNGINQNQTSFDSCKNFNIASTNQKPPSIDLGEKGILEEKRL